jgi:hypothetical protein
VDNLYDCFRILFILNNRHDSLERAYWTQVSQVRFVFPGDPFTDIFRFIAWYFLGAAGCLSPILYSTINTIVKDDSEERALIMVRGCFWAPGEKRKEGSLYQGAMMSVGYSFNIWVPLLAFPTAGPNGAPRWRRGWPVSFVFYLLLWAGFAAAITIHRR